MVEISWNDYDLPTTLEILTLNPDQASISESKLFDPIKNIENFPLNFVGRIYTDIGLGSGFFYKSKGKPYLISARHIFQSPIEEAQTLYVCFGYAQQNLPYEMELALCRQKICSEKFFKLLPTNIFANYPQNQCDPITGELFSIDNDITCFEILPECICGNALVLPDLNSLEIGEVPVLDEEIVVMGYPGLDFQCRNVLPHAPELENLIQLQESSMKPNALVVTKGKIIASNDLIAISAPSVSGMSGSPVLHFVDGKWKIFSVLIGGPAVSGHRKILEIVEAFKNCDPFTREKINQLQNLKPTSLFEKIKYNFYVSLNYCSSMFLKTCKMTYSKLISLKYEIEKSEQRFSKLILNHNLAIQVLPFISELESRL